MFDPKVTQRGVRIMSFRLVTASLPASLGQSATGCPEGYATCKVQRVAAGSFRLDVNVPFKRAPQLLVTPLSAAGSLKPVALTWTASSVTWKIKNDAGADTDPTEMSVFLMGCDTEDQLSQLA